MSVNMSDLIKELREKSGAGILDCKKALAEAGNDIEKAIDWLRKKGLAVANKKSDRVTSEGLVCVAKDDNYAVILEVNSETDFVGRNDQFQMFVKNVANIALKGAQNVEELKAQKYDGTKTVEEALVALIAIIGENLSIRRVERINIAGKITYSYIHNSIAENIGKIGVLVVLNAMPKNESLGRQLAMHIAASTPKALNIAELDKDLVEREMSVQKDLAKQSGKPDNIIEKMLEGRLSKFYQEVVLLEQPFVMDPDKKVQKVLQENSVDIFQYKIFILGEGIVKEVKDFAQEVADTLKN